MPFFRENPLPNSAVNGDIKSTPPITAGRLETMKEGEIRVFLPTYNTHTLKNIIIEELVTELKHPEKSTTEINHLMDLLERVCKIINEEK